MGDTLASELGMLSSSKPRMITTGAVVHPGCNGGVTTWGTLCSLAGGTFIGLLALLDLWIEQKLCYSTSSAFVLVSIATLAGGLGSAFDSILGATLQQTLYSEKERRVIKSIDQPTQDVRCVAGRNVLSNDQVRIDRKDCQARSSNL